MATEKQKRLAHIIKDCHDNLRIMTKIHGPSQAWEIHLKSESVLKEYADAMHELALIWEQNARNLSTTVRSRIKWIVDYCIKYFYTENILLDKRMREMRLLESWENCDISSCVTMRYPKKIKLLDVGSCFNPFQAEKDFDVTAIDLNPANKSVHRGDFLKIPVRDMVHPQIVVYDNNVFELPSQYFECVVFSLLLEYFPNPSQRLICCQKAYDLLKPEGILIIITPDSQHVGKNAKLMKNWRYTLATLGFSRIKFEKLPHITCMVFRKACDPLVVHRWAMLHREGYMTLSIGIPQDT